MVIHHSKKLLIVVSVVFVAIIIVVGGFLGYKYTQDRSSQGTSDTESLNESDQIQKELDEDLAEAEQAVKQIAEEQNKQAANISTLEDLAKLPEEDQGTAGIIIIRQAIEAGDTAKANQFIDYLLQKDTAKAIEAGLLCYQIAGDESRKSACVDRLNELARSQGIIESDEKLPEEYYQQTNRELR